MSLDVDFHVSSIKGDMSTPILAGGCEGDPLAGAESRKSGRSRGQKGRVRLANLDRHALNTMGHQVTEDGGQMVGQSGLYHGRAICRQKAADNGRGDPQGIVTGRDRGTLKLCDGMFHKALKMGTEVGALIFKLRLCHGVRFCPSGCKAILVGGINQLADFR